MSNFVQDLPNIDENLTSELLFRNLDFKLAKTKLIFHIYTSQFTVSDITPKQIVNIIDFENVVAFEKGVCMCSIVGMTNYPHCLFL